jgi:hypothetical protein
MSRIGILLLALASNGFGAIETLRYNVNWPSGLSLGEATLVTDNVDASAATRKFELKLDASIPGFAVSDEVVSLAKSDFCSIRLDTKLKHGSKLRNETTAFKPEEGVAERKTANGGTSKLPMSSCGRDALSLIYYLRSELKQGRIPGAQTVFFGAAYQIGFKYAGASNLQLPSGAEPADKLELTIQGPASRHAVEVFFGRDALRTPLLFRVPLPLGAFTMELQR